MLDNDRVASAIANGDLIPVEVFGTDSFGLCDRFSRHAPGGSDCNRAVKFLFRLSDEAMADPNVQDTLDQVLE
jgi:hypothetical protein